MLTVAAGEMTREEFIRWMRLREAAAKPSEASPPKCHGRYLIEKLLARVEATRVGRRPVGVCFAARSYAKREACHAIRNRVPLLHRRLEGL